MSIIVESFEDVPPLKAFVKCPKCERKLRTYYADVLSSHKKTMTVKVKGCRRCKVCYSGREGFVEINKHTAIGSA